MTRLATERFTAVIRVWDAQFPAAQRMSMIEMSNYFARYRRGCSSDCR